MLHKLVPAADPIALLTRIGTGPEPAAMQSAARVLGIRLLSLFGETESEVAGAFATLIEQHAGALVIGSNQNPPAVIDQIISLAGRYAVQPCFSPARELRAVGSLATESR
jgi:putative tryptophan/tyrosine transport system substrate-binding protein